MKRLIAMLMAVLMVALVFAACGPTTEPDDTTPAPIDETTPAPIDETDDPDVTTPDETPGSGDETTPPDVTTSDKGTNNPGTPTPPTEFSIAGLDPYYATPRLALEKELMDVYHKFEDDNNVTLKLVAGLTSGSEQQELATSHQSKKKIADFIRMKQEHWGTPAIKGMLRPLNTAEVKATGLDVKDKNMVDQFYTPLAVLVQQSNAKIWGVAFSGKYAITNFGFTYVFNKKILADHGYSTASMYQAVKDKKWDWQMFIDICEKVTEKKDSKGDPRIWGQTMMDLDSELATNKVLIMNYNASTKKWESGFKSKELQDATYFVFHCSLRETICVPEKAAPDNNARRQLFYDGKAAFACLWGAHFGSDGANVKAKDAYGVLPVPLAGPSTSTQFGTLAGKATAYKHIVPDLTIYCLQTVNDDWQNACKLMSKLGLLLNDEKAAEARMLSFFRNDKESLNIVKNILMPTAELQPARYSMTIKDSLDVVVELIVQSTGAPSVFANCHDIFQKAIDDTFGNYKE